MNNKILLLHVPQLESFSNIGAEFKIMAMPMGIFSIAHELKVKGFDVEILHLGVEKILNFGFSIADYIREYSIKMVLMTMHWHYQVYDVLEVARKIKENNPETLIVLGGYTASAFPEDFLLKYYFIDVVVKGEGEVPCVTLAQRFFAGNDEFFDIPNLHWKNKRARTIVINPQTWVATADELSNFNFTSCLENMLHYSDYLTQGVNRKINFQQHTMNEIAREKLFYCCLGRGCPVNCAWCGGSYKTVECLSGRRQVALRTPESIFREIVELYEKYNVSDLYICYDPFPFDESNFIALLILIGEKYPKMISVTFECFGLPSPKMIDVFQKNLNAKSKLLLSPDLASEMLRKRYKGYYYSNEELLQSVDYICNKNISLEIMFMILPCNMAEEDNAREKLINLIKEKHKTVEIDVQNVIGRDPLCPWMLHSENYPELRLSVPSLDDYYQNGKKLRELW